MANQGNHPIFPKLLLVAMWLLIFATTISFSIHQFPLPRPRYVFVGYGLAIACGCLTILSREKKSKTILVGLCSGGVLISFLLRWSGYVRVLNSGDDHARFVTGAMDILHHGKIVSGLGMYDIAPIILVQPAVSTLVVGTPITFSRILLILSISMLPGIIAGAAYGLTKDLNVGLLSLFLASPFVLFLRTSALLEPESFALLLFGLCLLLFSLIKLTQSGIYVAFLLIMAASVFLHHLYSTIIIFTIGIAIYVKYTIHSIDKNMNTLPTATLVLLAPPIVLLFHMIISANAGRAVDFLIDFVVGISSVLSSEESVFGLFLPSSGILEQSSGLSSGGSAGNPVQKFANFFQIIIFALSSLVSGLFLLAKRRRKHHDMLVLGLVCSVVTIGFILKGGHPKFRFYYFLSVLMVIFTSYLYVTIGSRFRLTSISIVLLILSLAVVGPMTPLGNQTDPQIGGEAWVLTQSQFEQLQSLDRIISGPRDVPVRVSSIRSPRQRVLAESAFVPSGNENMHVSGDACMYTSMWSSGNLFLCHEIHK